jgi:hypothetical protein
MRERACDSVRMAAKHKQEKLEENRDTTCPGRIDIL